MLFKVIDPNFVLSETYRTWPLETKATYTVCAALANYQTGEFYHSSDKIAHHANISRRAVQRSLRRMEAAGQLTIEGPPRRRSFVYTFATRCQEFLTGRKRQQLATGESPLATGESPLATGESLNSTEIPLQTPAQPASTATPSVRNKQILTKEIITTTKALRITERFFWLLTNKYGFQNVYQRAVVISGMNGEVKNKAGLLVDSLQKGYIPTNKELRAKQEAKAKREAARKKSEQLQQELQKQESEAAPQGSEVVQRCFKQAAAIFTDVEEI